MESNLITDFLYQFVTDNPEIIIKVLIVSFVIDLFQTIGISFATGELISSFSKKEYKNTGFYFKLFIVFSIITIGLNSLYKYLVDKVSSQIRELIRHFLIKIILLISNDKFGSMNYLKMSSPINRISNVVFHFFNEFCSFLLPNLILLVVISLCFLIYNPIIGLIFILGNAGLLAYIVYTWDSIIEHNTNYQNSSLNLESYLLDILNNIDKIISRGQVEPEIEEFQKKVDVSLKNATFFNDHINWHITIMSFFIYGIMFALIGYMLYLFFNNKIELPIIITFITIMLLYRDKMLYLINEVPDFAEFYGRAVTVLKNFEHMKDEYAVVSDKLVAKAQHDGINGINGIDESLEFNQITFKDVSYKYPGTDKFVLENWTFSFSTDNKIIGITGLSGNGKSTFAKLMLKMYPPDSGDIEIDGKNLKTLDSNYIRKEITFVGQNGKLFDKTVIDNIFYGCSDLVKCEAYLADIMKYPKIAELYKNVDFKTKSAGSLGENLSGGQRQVVNIISGMINPSHILILDEPTNALDPELKKEVIQLIKDFKGHKKCVIIITHDRDVMTIFNDVIKL